MTVRSMSSELAISVIMSTHNRAGYLPDALTALAAQDCDVAFEVIVIDNASTDNTSAILEEWCRTDSRFRTARETRLGLSCGKNAGIRMAQAPLLLFTDDDMLADPHWIRSYYNFFARQTHHLMLAGGPCIPIPHDLNEWPNWVDEPSLVDVALLHFHEERALKKAEYVWGGNMAVPASLFERFGRWDEAVGRKGEERGTFEDTEFQDRIRTAGIPVWFCAAAAVRHRILRETITPRQLSSTAFTRGRNDFWRQKLKVWHEVEAIPNRNIFGGVLVLGGNLFRWAFWTITFRLFHGRRVFERARRAAFWSGYSLDSLRPGRNSSRLYGLTSRFAFRARSLVLGLIPNVS
jgi:glycosyltransferase involved in cell wall biosynthesis